MFVQSEGVVRRVTGEKIEFVQRRFFTVQIIQCFQGRIRMMIRRRVIRLEHDAIRIQIVFAESECRAEVKGTRERRTILLDIVIDLIVFQKGQRRERLVEIVTGVFQNVWNGSEERRWTQIGENQEFYRFDSPFASPFTPPLEFASLLMPSNFFTAFERISMIVST